MVGSLLPTLGEHLLSELDVEAITAKLQQTRQAQTVDDGTKDILTEEQRQQLKVALWENLKTLS